MKARNRKAVHLAADPRPASAQPAHPLQPFAFRTSCRRLLAFYSGSLWSEQDVLDRQLHRAAANAARRGDQGARDFLTDLLHEQAV